MPKCKFCTDDFEYSWTKIDNKWKLANPNTGTPHQCKKDKPQEISASTNVIKKSQESGGEEHSKLWKKDWTPEMEGHVYRICGICKTHLIETNDCEFCHGTRRLKTNCNDWCPTCKIHSKVVYVQRDPILKD